MGGKQAGEQGRGEGEERMGGEEGRFFLKFNLKATS